MPSLDRPHAEERAKCASRSLGRLVLRDAVLRTAPQDEAEGDTRIFGYPFALASDFARIASSVSIGVEMLVSTLRWMIEGLPNFSQARNAATKSAVFSTRMPKPPNALA